MVLWQGTLLCHHTEQDLTPCTRLSLSLHGKWTACLWSCKKSPACYMWPISNSKAQVKGSAEMSAGVVQCKSQHRACLHPPKREMTDLQPYLKEDSPIISSTIWHLPIEAQEYSNRSREHILGRSCLQAEGNSTPAAHLPPFLKAELMSPERDGRVAMTRTGTPSTFLPWSPTDQSKEQRTPRQGERLRAEPGFVYISWLHRCIHCTFSACEFPISGAAALEGFITKWMVQGHCNVSFQDNMTVLSTCFPPAQRCSSFNCSNFSVFSILQKESGHMENTEIILKNTHLLSDKEPSNTAMSLWGKPHSLPTMALGSTGNR